MFARDLIQSSMESNQDEKQSRYRFRISAMNAGIPFALRANLDKAMREMDRDTVQKLFTEMILEMDPANEITAQKLCDEERIFRKRELQTNICVRDSLNLARKSSIQTLLKNERVYYSGKLAKINKNGKMQSRVCLITNAALYNLSPEDKFDRHELKRRIELLHIGLISIGDEVSVQGQDMTEIVLHVPTSYDYKYLVPQSQVEELTTMMSQFISEATLLEAAKKTTTTEALDSYGIQLSSINNSKYLVDDTQVPIITKKVSSKMQPQTRQDYYNKLVMKNIVKVGLILLKEKTEIRARAANDRRAIKATAVSDQNTDPSFSTTAIAEQDIANTNGNITKEEIAAARMKAEESIKKTAPIVDDVQQQRMDFARLLAASINAKLPNKQQQQSEELNDNDIKERASKKEAGSLNALRKNREDRLNRKNSNSSFIRVEVLEQKENEKEDDSHSSNSEILIRNSDSPKDIIQGRSRVLTRAGSAPYAQPMQMQFNFAAAAAAEVKLKKQRSSMNIGVVEGSNKAL